VKEKKMFKKQIILLISALLVTSMALASCGAPATEVPPTPIIQVVEKTVVVEPTPLPIGGDTLSFAISLDPETLDNAKTTSETVAGVLEQYLLEGLVYFDKEGKVQGWLAESWEVSADGLQITFHLRQGVKFHDGTDFNADAVKFQFDRILDPATASPALAYIPTLTAVDKVDDYTVKFTFSAPDAGFWVVVTYAYFCFNSPTAVQAAGDDYGRQPVGTGPFMFESWIPGSQLTFVKNPNYQQFRTDTANKGPAYADKIILYVIPEAGTVRAALQTGEILASNISADILPDFVSDPNFNIAINKQVTSMQFLDFNNKKAPFDNVEFRKAISYAIDRKAIVTNSRGGYAYESLNLLAPGLPGYDPTIGETYGAAYDPAKANEILDGLGWVVGADGIREKDGQKASWTIKSYSGYAYVTRSLEVIQQNLKAVGIEVDIEISDWSAFYPSLLDDSLEMDMMRWSWSDTGVLNVLFRSPGYRGHLPEDPELDALLDTLMTTMDPAERDAVSIQAQQMLLEKMIAVPLQANWIISAVRSNVMGYNLDWFGMPLVVDMYLAR
jgi:peptide/nickel transport system substrate-binding protein